MDQNFYVAHWNLGRAYEMKGQFPYTIAEYQKARPLNHDPSVLALLGHAYAGSDKRNEVVRREAALRRGVLLCVSVRGTG
ncbi:MAG: hypothetical protein ABI967_05425 [bacterium]